MYKYLSEEHLRGFDKYKYNAKDTSPLSVYIMHPFWNAVVKIFPEWFSPNLMTFLGFLILVVSFVVLSVADWTYYASSRNHQEYPSVSNLLFLLVGIGLLLAHTLDGIDGKQARRTNSSTPLGELFDHGSDSIICGLLPIGVFSVFGRDKADYGADVWLFYIIVCIVVSTFYISHWEKYLTGVMFLPWSYDFSQLTLVVVYILSGIFGYEMWKGTYALGFEFRHLFILATLGGALLLSLPNTIWNVYESYRDGTGKNRSFYQALEPVFPPAILFLATSLWASLSQTDILQQEPRLFFLTIGIIMSNITCYLIISQMTETKARNFNFLLVPVIMTATVSVCINLGPIEMRLLYCLFAAVTFAHFHYAVCVVVQLAEHFNIYVFSLKKRIPKAARVPNGSK